MASKAVDLGIEGIGPATLVARGGSAEVYQAEQQVFGRRVAIKVLFDPVSDDDVIGRFDRECRTIGAVSGHPNIVVVHGRGLTPGARPYLIMEYCSGGSLANRLQLRGRLTERETIDVGMKIGTALAVAHRAGVIHRDVKPANVLLSAWDEPALADFGIARMEGLHKTTQRVFSASVAHAGREVLEGGVPSERSDIYSLGSTLFELATGRTPFGRPGEMSMWAIIDRALREDPPDPRRHDIGEGLSRVLERALSHDPDARHRDADELVGELRALTSGRGVTAPAADTLETPIASPSGGTVDEADGKALPAITTTPDSTAPGDPRPRPPSRVRLAVVAIAALALVAVTVGGAMALSSVGGGGAGIDDRASSATAADPDGDDRAGDGDIAPAGLDDADVSGETGADPAPVPRLAAFSPLLRFGRSSIGPLLSGERYAIEVDDAPPQAHYRIVVDGRGVTDRQPDVPVFYPTQGRHVLQVEVSTDAQVKLTEPVDIYVSPRGPESGFRANLAAIRSQPESWPEALRQFDQMLADGHDDLELSLSSRDDGDRFPYWNYYVDGFGDDAEGAQAYCDRFELGPADCFVAEVD